MILLRCLTFLLRLQAMILTVLLLWISFFLLTPALLDFFFSSNASIYSTMAFSPFGNADDVVVPFFIDSIKFTIECPVSLHSLCLFSC